MKTFAEILGMIFLFIFCWLIYIALVCQPVWWHITIFQLLLVFGVKLLIWSAKEKRNVEADAEAIIEAFRRNRGNQ